MFAFHQKIGITLALCACHGALAAPAPSLCDAKEQVAFSCPISRTHKTVSLCLGAVTGDKLPARYVFGTATHPELVYPSSPGGNATFHSTHLSYAAAAGGNAYSFEIADIRYILYSVSGTGFDHAGVLVQHKGQNDASADLACRPDTAADAMNYDLPDRDAMNFDLPNGTRAWGADPEIARLGLPLPPS